jgi:hypothetical protein
MMNRPEAADDDDIGSLIYQHAKTEKEKVAAVLAPVVQERDRMRSDMIALKAELQKAKEDAKPQPQAPPEDILDKLKEKDEEIESLRSELDRIKIEKESMTKCYKKIFVELKEAKETIASIETERDGAVSELQHVKSENRRVLKELEELKSLQQAEGRQPARIKQAAASASPKSNHSRKGQLSARIKQVVASASSIVNHSREEQRSAPIKRVKCPWLKRYNELVDYKRDFGNCRVPQRYAPNPQLANWVRSQRVAFKDNLLVDDRIKKLNRIGFDWEVDTWEEYFNDLVQYKSKFGDCRVPQKKYAKNPLLGSWVLRQRRKFKKKSLSDDQIERLNKVGFEWEVRDLDNNQLWTTRYNELIEYKREFKNCDVPKRHKPNIPLGLWVQRQRIHFKNKSLSKDRVAKLNRVGFAWQSNFGNKPYSRSHVGSSGTEV